MQLGCFSIHTHIKLHYTQCILYYILEIRRSTYRGLIRAKQDGYIRYIGVSNFTISHLIDFIDICQYEVPYINQIEIHPLCTQIEVIQYCKKYGILIQVCNRLIVIHIDLQSYYSSSYCIYICI